MEQYRILQRLGKGAQGSVYLAENRIEGKKYVLKKIECKDEGEANHAFKEAVALKELQHPYICGFKEFFVFWDKEDSAIYFCMVMEFYEKGDLSSVLRMKRLKEEAVDETLVKKWFGQITGALLYVHKKGLIHRDLKPSNLLLRQNMDLCLGDFGVATVMSDAKSNTRASVGTLNYMSPELSTEGYTEKSDVWALGCVLLEILTCSTSNQQDILITLQDIKSPDSDCLDNILGKISQIYDSELVSILQSLLNINSSRRADLKSLLSVPYVRESVQMVDTEYIHKKKKQMSAGRNRTPLPREGDIKSVLEHLRSIIDCGDKVLETMAHLEDLAKEPAITFDALGKLLILEAMTNNLSDLSIQISGLAILNRLITEAKPGDILFSEDVVCAIPKILKSHKESSDLIEAASMFILALSADEKAADMIGRKGVIEELLNSLKFFSTSTTLCASVCNTLWSLAVLENNTRILSEKNGLEIICETLKAHMDTSEVVESAAACLLSLSMEDESLTYIGNLDTVGLLVHSIESHPNNAKVIKNSCLALASFVELDEESAFKVLACENEKGEEVAGLQVLLSAYSVHKDNADVVEAICTLLMELASYEEVHRELCENNVRYIMENISQMYNGNQEIKAEMNFLKIGQTMLAEVQKRFKENKDITGPCRSTQTALGPIPKPENHVTFSSQTC